MVQKLCMSINKDYIIIWLDNALAEDAWCIWWLCPHLPDSDDAMNISGVMNLNMHYSFSNICMWRVQDGGCEAVCMMEISVCVYQYMSGLIDSHWHALRAGPVCAVRAEWDLIWRCCDCLEEESHIVHAARDVLLSCGSPWWIFPGFSWLFQAAVSHYRSSWEWVRRFVIWSDVFLSFASRGLMWDSPLCCCIAVYRRVEAKGASAGRRRNCTATHDGVLFEMS